MRCCAAGDRVLVALSGGSDSVALLRLLRELASAGELTVAGAAHLNHGLREPADRDEQFCRALARSCGVPFRSDLVDVRGAGAHAGDFARGCRTAGALRAVRARRDRARRRCRGHRPHARRSGRDVPATADPRRRPARARRHSSESEPAHRRRRRREGRIQAALDLGRDELRAYLASLGQAFRDDESNSDVSIPRNRVRHELLPLLTRDFSPGIVDVLAREAAIARDDEDRLQRKQSICSI